MNTNFNVLPALAIPTKLPQVNITPVQNNVTAKITQIYTNFGYIKFTLDNALLQKTLTKNGAVTLPSNNGELFFHETELSGPKSSYKIGDLVKFDVVHSKKSNKLIGNRINKVDDVIEKQTEQVLKTSEINQLCHFQKMQVDELQDYTVLQPKYRKISLNNTGKITEIYEKENYGYLENAETEKIFFHANYLIGTHLSTLKVNDQIKFDLYKNIKTGEDFAKNVNFVENKELASEENEYNVNENDIRKLAIETARAQMGEITINVDQPSFSTSMETSIYNMQKYSESNSPKSPCDRTLALKSANSSRRSSLILASGHKRARSIDNMELNSLAARKAN